MVAVPELETDRLRLRAHRIEDFGELAAVWSDPIVVRHFGGHPLTREDAWARLLRYAGHWALLGFGFWAIEERDSGSYVGDIGFARFQREIEPPLPDVPEIGWVLASRVHGKGYATEAAMAVLAHGLETVGLERIIAVVMPANVASCRVVEKAGMKFEGTATYYGIQNLRKYVAVRESSYR